VLAGSLAEIDFFNGLIGVGTMAIESINPATGDRMKAFEEFSWDQLDKRLDQARRTFEDWRERSFEYRAERMRRMAALLKDRSRALGEIITQEMGKPITQAVAEVNKCAWVCEYYAENAEALLGRRIKQTDASQSYVRYDPMGPVLAVMPWNFPFWQVYRFSAPALMAGNVGVLKHASNVPQAALAIEACHLEAGFPEGAFTTLLISARATEGVIKDRRIVAATLTGSEPAGRKIASTSGSVLKKTVMELGGSDPFIVLADADLDRAVEVGVTARNQKAGQGCSAAKRFVVVKEGADAVAERFEQRLRNVVVGDPMDEKTQVGPMARADLREEVNGLVAKSIDEGAKLVLGGRIPGGPGFFYPVTMLKDVKSHMAVAREETFGPVAPLIVVQDEEEALRVANDTPFGLGASLWTKDEDKAHAYARRIETGSVFVNEMVKSDPRLPFGGIKNSGYGRELSEEGIREFVNTKTVYIA